MADTASLEEIHVLNHQLRLLHPAKGGFRTSIDTVLVAAACPARPGQSLLDLGCGVGGAGLCVARRVGDIALTGIEIMPEHAELAAQNARLNALPASFICGDIRGFAADMPKPVYDHVICNPPYLEAGTYYVTPDEERASALGHRSDDICIIDWVKAAHICVKSKGSVTFIYRADGLDRLLAALGRKFGQVEIIPLWPRAGEPAKRVIVRAIKDRRGGLTLHNGLVLHDSLGYTAEAEAVLRAGKALLL